MLNRILAAFYPIRVGGCKFFIQQAFDWDFLCEADEIYEEFRYKNRFSLLTKQQIKIQLIKRGLISPSVDQELIKYNKEIEKQQEEMYRNNDNPTQVTRLRQRLKALKSAQNKIFNLLSKHYINSLEDKSEYEKIKFITLHSVFDKDMKAVREIDVDLLLTKINSLTPKHSEVRKIARTDPWRTLWSIKRGSAFQYSPLTHTQSVLASYSKFYDNVYKNPQCPNNVIVNDDDMLDGWYSIQVKNSEQKPTKTTAAHKHGEVFEMVQSKNELEDLVSSNNPVNLMKMKARQQQIMKAGGRPVEHGSLNDVKMKHVQG